MTFKKFQHPVKALTVFSHRAVLQPALLSHLDVQALKVKLYNMQLEKLAEGYADATSHERKQIEDNFVRMKTSAFASNSLKNEAIGEFIQSCPRLSQLVESCVQPPPTRESPLIHTRLKLLFDTLDPLKQQRREDIFEADTSVPPEKLKEGWACLRERVMIRPSSVQLRPLY
eukprot:TRINITY_DN67970_c0_g1_i1.p1 TRINITY_DN67970_c0_g1~~TRINITY_DN67970_c0_g1_i1.p1  ORF type:complete len:172 (+),score=41.80 TRINITY_DN67970_c0_g1_i1:282-797(+)